MNFKTGGDDCRGLDTEDRTNGGGSKRDRTSKIFSIFRWFKRDRSSSLGSDSSTSPHNSPELYRRPPDSIGGSVDTLFSTATANSFAFVHPSYYRPFGSAAQAEIRIALAPDTASYKNRIRQRDRLRQIERNITLKEKYRLYGSGTLPRSVDRINEFPVEFTESIFRSVDSTGSGNSTFGRKKRRAPQPPCRETSTSDKSLPATLELNKSEEIYKQHRRALSEPVKYVKAYHVKGKRKAPPPPTHKEHEQKVKRASYGGERTLSLNRKKRQAPPPPPIIVDDRRGEREPIIDIVREAAHEILNQSFSTNGSIDGSEDNKAETASTASTVDIGLTDIVATDTLRLEKGILKPTKMEASMLEPKFSPTSPVSPRPWYKRQSTYKDHQSSKSNERKKDKKKVEDWMLESGFPRRVTSPNMDSKFNIFSKMDKSEEKRRSQISILTNISELDREAAEIIQKGKEREKALIASHDAMFYTNTEQDENDDTPKVQEINQETDETPKRTSTRELISLFNAVTNVNKVSVNTSFFSRDNLFKRESEKRSSLFMDRTKAEDCRITEISNGHDTKIIGNYRKTEHEDANPQLIAHTYRTPDIIIDENGASSSSAIGNEGKITKVTIEELDEYDAERNSRAQAMYEANRLTRHQSPPISTITEVSESSFKSSPASTFKSSTSESTSSESASPVQLPSFASHKSIVWICPRCTLENLRWRITCEACDMWRPIPCEFKEQSHGVKKTQLPVLKIVEKKDEENNLVKIKDISKESDNKNENPVKNDELIIKEILISRDKSNENPVKSIDKEDTMQQSKIMNDTKTWDMPSTSGMSKETIPKIQCQPLPAVPKEDTAENAEDPQAEEIRKARLAFFGKSKQKEDTLTKECQTATDKVQRVAEDVDDDKRKLREMLKEMKHSLPKRPKPEKDVKKPINELEIKEGDNQIRIKQENLGAISKIPDLSIKKDKKAETVIGGNDKRSRDVVRCDDNEKAEAYLVDCETIVEEIHYKKQPEKVSSSVQTSALVKAVPPATENKQPPPKEVIVPITVEEYRIKDGVLYTSVTKKAKRIGTGTFHLMRPRDFANIEAIKKSDKAVAPVYANVPNDEPGPSTSSTEESSLPETRSPVLSAKSKNLSVEKLSMQLTKPLGVASFRAGLAPGKENNSMNTIAVNRLLRRLETAIAGGHHELAAALARELAQMQISCSVIRQKPDIYRLITVDLYVEDKTSHQGPIALRLKPNMTVLQLKQKMERDYEIPLQVQRWILNRTLANDDASTLDALGVTDNTPIFLYLVAPAAEGGEASGGSNETVEVLEEPLLNTEEAAKPVETTQPIIEEPTIETQIHEQPNLTGTLALGWKCETCTLVNSPTRPGCAACASTRPINYEIPIDYVANEDEAMRLDLVKKIELEAAAIEKEKKELNYQKMLDMVEKDDLILYTEEFECPICLMECEPLHGVVLRECLHVFCRPCLGQTVEFSDEAEVKCPYRDNNYTCDSTLLEREIKALVTAEVYEQHLAKSIALAETKIANAFHCKTPDCKGWCIYEDNVNLFRCPVCTHINCLTCQAVHEGLDCKQFQEQLNKDSDTNAESRRTKEMLQEMVDRGEAMNCPTCQVILMKKWGCDWLKCSMCKTEICWITRGPRWGPNGKGDTSGGCQCGVNGVKCHPKCTYCH